jgi:predicted nucleic acid-binding Zn ribbon protein
VGETLLEDVDVMPVYVYRNLATGETFEFEQRISEPALSTHPKTGDPVKRLIQPVGIAFKGSGFYINDSRHTSSSSKAASTPNAESKTESKSEPKAEAKTETKSEAKTTSKAETKNSSKDS